MAYEVYLGNMLCPIAPSSVQTKIKNQNKTMNLMNDGEINILKSPGLTEISFDLLLPNVKYPFATYKSGFVNAKFFLDELERLKVEKKTFPFKIIRKFPNGKMLFENYAMVSLEDYTIKEDAKQGFDVVVSIKLKHFKDYGTKKPDIIIEDEEVKVSPETVRETENSPAPTSGSTTTHTVVSGDTLWNIAKKYYGDGSKHNAIFEANKDKISNPNLIYPGQVLVIPNVSETSTSGNTSTSTSGNTSTSTSGNTSTSTSTVKATNKSGSSTITATIPKGFENYFKVGIAYNDENGNYKFTGYGTSVKATTSIGRKVTLKLDAVWHDTVIAYAGIFCLHLKAKFNYWTTNGIAIRGTEGRRDYTFNCGAVSRTYTANCSKIEV